MDGWTAPAVLWPEPPASGAQGLVRGAELKGACYGCLLQNASSSGCREISIPAVKVSVSAVKVISSQSIITHSNISPFFFQFSFICASESVNLKNVEYTLALRVTTTKFVPLKVETTYVPFRDRSPRTSEAPRPSNQNGYRRTTI